MELITNTIARWDFDIVEIEVQFVRVDNDGMFVMYEHGENGLVVTSFDTYTSMFYEIDKLPIEDSSKLNVIKDINNHEDYWKLVGEEEYREDVEVFWNEYKMDDDFV